MRIMLRALLILLLRLSVALQAGKAAIAFGGLQRLRTEQLAWDLPLSPGLNDKKTSAEVDPVSLRCDSVI